MLPGRNSLLGALSDSIFTCVARISDNKAIICSEKGDICLLDDSDGNQRLTKVAHAGFGVSCVAVNPDGDYAWVAGKQGNIRCVALESMRARITLKGTRALVLKHLISPATPPDSPSSRSGSPSLPFGSRPANVVAMASMAGHLLTVDSSHSIKVVNMTTSDGAPVPHSVMHELPAHRDPVMGVRLLPQPNLFDSWFFTWSSGGSVLFWDMDGCTKGEMSVELEQLVSPEDETSNELKVVQSSPQGDFFVSGDKFGVLR